jgi:uncharacterized membrane protein YhiD involved in acid resistance
MTTIAFTVRLGCAFVLGTVIGVERLWCQRAAGLRTNVLVALGSALFVRGRFFRCIPPTRPIMSLPSASGRP